LVLLEEQLTADSGQLTANGKQLTGIGRQPGAPSFERSLLEGWETINLARGTVGNHLNLPWQSASSHHSRPDHGELSAVRCKL
jgi:hypothetical protein